MQERKERGEKEEKEPEEGNKEDSSVGMRRGQPGAKGEAVEAEPDNLKEDGIATLHEVRNALRYS